MLTCVLASRIPGSGYVMVVQEPSLGACEHNGFVDLYVSVFQKGSDVDHCKEVYTRSE